MRRLLIAGLFSCTAAPVMPPHAPLVPEQGTALLDPSTPPPVPFKLRDTPPPGPPTPLSAPGPADGQIGTAHQAYVTAADPMGRWVLICQARADTDENGWIHFGIAEHGINEGDKASLYLVRGSGEGEAIEGLIARDGSGRWLVIGRGHHEILLLDLEQGTSTPLFPSITSTQDELYPLKPSTITFDPSGQYLLYRRRSKRHIVLVVRHLDSGTETIVDPGAGALVSAGWRTSAWLHIRTVRDDLNGDHKIEYPRDYSSGWVGTCGLGSTTYMAGWSADISDQHIAWSTGLRLGDAYTTLGDELLVDDAGKVAAVAPSGARRPLDIAPGCWPIFGDAPRDQVFAGCHESGVAHLEVSDARGRRRIGRIDENVHELRVWSPRIVELNPLAESMAWLDLERGRLISRGRKNGWTAVGYGRHALVRGNHDKIVELATGRTRAVLGPTYMNSVLSADRLAFARPWLIDLERGERLAKLDRQVHAITRDGRLLVDTGEGVLRWRPWTTLQGRRGASKARQPSVAR